MTVTIEIPTELVRLLGSEEEAKREAKTALVLDLVRRGKISKAKAADLLQLSLSELPELLAQYRIPRFDYSADELDRDLKTLQSKAGPAE